MGSEMCIRDSSRYGLKWTFNYDRQLPHPTPIGEVRDSADNLIAWLAGKSNCDNCPQACSYEAVSPCNLVSRLSKERNLGKATARGQTRFVGLKSRQRIERLKQSPQMAKDSKLEN